MLGLVEIRRTKISLHITQWLLIQMEEIPQGATKEIANGKFVLAYQFMATEYSCKLSDS